MANLKNKYEPNDEDRKKVINFSSVGVPQADICKVIGITEKTLRKYYREELDTSAINANAQVAGWLFGQCKQGNTTAMLFWLKTRAKWRETDSPMSDSSAEPVTSITYVGQDASKPK